MATRNADLAEEVGPGIRFTYPAGATVYQDRIVQYSGNDVVLATAGSVNYCGVSIGKHTASGDANGDALVGNSVVIVRAGAVPIDADVNIQSGELLKVGHHGKATPALTYAKTNQTRDSSTGQSFANQPANDGIEVVSSSASDTMDLIIYGTTNGGFTVVKETVTLNGTSAVSTVKTDWGVCLGFEIPTTSDVPVGTITVREASGNATISTLTAGNRQKGVENVPAGNQRCFNKTISVAGDSATTKVVGYVGVNSVGAAVMEAAAATGTTKVQYANKLSKITKLLVGDLETARTATYKTNHIPDVGPVIIGTALTSASVAQASAGGTVLVDFTPQAGKGVIGIATEASSAVSNTASETTFTTARTPVPADTLVAGKILRIRGQGITTAANANDTLAIKVYLGGTAVVTIPATDATTNDVWQFSFDIIPRAEPGATSACVGFGTYGMFGAAGTATQRSTILASTNFATNGELNVTCTATWSAADAGNSCRLDCWEVELI